MRSFIGYASKMSLQVYALTKERDALKRGNEKLADYSSLLKEKDGIIKQVCLASLG